MTSFQVCDSAPFKLTEETDSDICESDIDSVIITFNSTRGKTRISASKSTRFSDVKKIFCEQEGWSSNKIRCLLDGDRLQDELTCQETEIQHHAEIDVFHEMIGGSRRGKQDEEDIRKMIDDLDDDGISSKDENCADEDDEEDEEESIIKESSIFKKDSSCGEDTAKTKDSEFPKESISKKGSLTLENKESKEANAVVEDLANTNKKWYEELKLQYEEGRLKLCRSKPMDTKLILLLEAKIIHQSELLRFKNIFRLWEQHNTWSNEKAKEDQDESNENLNICRKRSIPAEPSDDNFSDESTPFKRRKILSKFDLKTPSPTIKKADTSEKEMMGISVAIHLWAEREMGDIRILQSKRLMNDDFENILKFAGPDSKWNLLKDRTAPQLRSLWRNTFAGIHFYRGHHKTGFENEFRKHEPLAPYCPFGHCKSGIMSPMDVALILLTPNSKPTVKNTDQKTLINRNLFGEINNESITDSVEVQKMQEVSLLEKRQFESEAVCQSSGDNGEEDLSTKKTDENEEIEMLTEVEQVPKFECIEDGCLKIFITLNGLEKHMAEKHPTLKLVKNEIECKICLKSVKYLDKHLKAKHSDLQETPVCEICLKEIHSDMKKHRKLCIKCPYCDYENAKKARLLNHMKMCKRKQKLYLMRKADQTEPLDLSSPLKVPRKIPDENHDENQEEKDKKSEHHEAKGKTESDENEVIGEKQKVKEITKTQTICEENGFEEGRSFYPFDEGTTDEDYYSEFDIDDNESFTRERRRTKDEIEIELRKIDLLENEEIEGDTIIVDKFIEFMRNKTHKDENNEGYGKISEPSTINCYAGILKNDILRAFHKLCSPFDARWLLDCKTAKVCAFEGEERRHVSQEEPIYITSRVLEESLCRYKKTASAGTKKKQIIATFRQLMDFVELHFTVKLNAFGIDVLKRVLAYHKGVKTFIKATSQWKSCDIEEKQAYEKNKLIKDYKNPNKDKEVLEKYKEYIKSEDRISKLNKLLSYANPDADIPPAAVMSELGVFVMEEIVGCTGCRPKVVRHLNMGAYVDKKPGFNPRRTNGEDAEVEESFNNEKILRRVDPNLPPKDKACIHQLRDKSAICTENCEDQCIPEGFNIWCTWDKTQNTNGPYFLHLPTPIKDIMDSYDLVRSNFFKDKKSKFSSNDAWLDADSTPFFLNSVCGPFPSLDLKKLSASLGIDVTAYAFRKIVSTWALTHECEDIRNAETEALQHSLKVAKERYLQSKQVQPQNLTQTYAREENLFPANFKKVIEKGKVEVNTIIFEKQEKRAKARYSKLIQEKSVAKNVSFLNKPLGPRQIILEADRIEFFDIVEEVTGNSSDDLLSNLKPVQWRDFVVKITCSATGECGEKLRRLWLKMYKGDLRFGVRDKRKEAKERNWPLRKQNPGRRDRNSWISSALRKSCVAAKKSSELSKM